MPEEIEVPTEHLHEHMEHEAEEAKSKWILGVALSSAFLAAFAAVASLMAGHHANEAMIDQIKSSDQWAFYQAKGVKAAVLSSKMELLATLKHRPSDADQKKLGEYKDDQDKISEEAKKDEESSEAHLAHHVILARSVTLFQVAIAIGAIAALARRRAFWYVSLGFGGVGLFFFIQGLLV
ncbi:MAG TPA: DUF4337 family protein [bacterium]|jgi:hypothetical protein|nr:DUF4337 family protein [bacterium]